MTTRRRLVLPLALLTLAAVVAGAPAWAFLPESGGNRLLPQESLLRLAGSATGPAPAGVAAVPSSSAPAGAGNLGERVAADLASSGATTVAAAVDVDGVGQVLREEPDHALPPASTRKTFTVTAALLALGPDFRFTTSALSTAAPSRGLLRGNLWLVAGGDPYLTSTGLRGLAHAVRAAGITRIGGSVLLDDSRYDAQRSVSGWKGSFVPDESGPLSALSVDENSGRHDAAYLRDPALPNAQRFAAYLADEGVTVHGGVRRASQPASARTVAVVRSGPLSAVVRRLAKASDNFAAELLAKELGRQHDGAGTSAAGVRAVREVLAALSVTPGPATDGSGLSGSDRQTVSGELALLEAVDRSGVAGLFRAALPIACRDGTLVHRMCGTAAEGRVVAKTGTLDGVAALAGFTRTASGRAVWFSFLLTGSPDAARARAAIDHAAEDLTADAS